MGEGVAPHRLGNGTRVREEEERYGGGGVFCPSAHTEVTVFQLNPPPLPLTSDLPISEHMQRQSGGRGTEWEGREKHPSTQDRAEHSSEE